MSGQSRAALQSQDLDAAHVLLAKPLDYRLVRSVWAAAYFVAI
jgi:hypothetical protein